MFVLDFGLVVVVVVVVGGGCGFDDVSGDFSVELCVCCSLCRAD